MPEQSRSCPQCNGIMAYRLGEYECPQCGHQESAQAEPEPTDTRTRPGLKPPQQYGRQADSQGGLPDHGGYGPAQAPPPMGTLHGSSGDLYGDPYGFAPPPPGGDSLTIEKNIYFGLTIAGHVINFIAQIALSSSFGSIMAPQGVGGGGGYLAAGIASNLISSAIGLLILWFALYGTAIWAKWCCLSLQVIGIIWAISMVVWMNSMLGSYAGAPPGMGGMAIGIMFVAVIFQLAWIGWFISILYRDIKRLGG